MRNLFFPAIVCVVSLTAVAVASDPLGELGGGEFQKAREEAVETGEQTPRGILESSIVIETSPEIFSETESQLLGELRAAKRAGDLAAALLIEEELARLRNKPLTFMTPESADDEPLVVVFADEAGEPINGRWLPDDIPIVATDVGEGSSELACDSHGRLFAAFSSGAGAGSVFVYRSTNGGDNWYLWLGIMTPFSRSPSIAIAEGLGEDWLFIAYKLTPYEQPAQIRVTRITLDYPIEYDHTTIEENAAGITPPRIVSDSDEYAGWYVYLIYNYRTPLYWTIHFSRSLTYGASWTTPEAAAAYCGLIGDFFNAAYRPPDIEYGSNNLYIAFENYPGYCEGPERDIFLMTSRNYGGSWQGATMLTSGSDDKFSPAVAAVKNYTAHKTAMVAYTRDYASIDNDIWYAYTQDDGATWDVNNCLSCAAIMDEQQSNLATGPSRGSIHAAYWYGSLDATRGDIDYAVAHHTDLDTWMKEYAINEGGDAIDWDRPGIVEDRSDPMETLVGISWTDYRDYVTNAGDIYFDRTTFLPSDVGEDDASSSASWLRIAGPNPGGCGTTISYELPQTAHVTLGIYDVAGHRLRVLEDGLVRQAGRHQVDWDGSDDAGERLACGVYFCRLEASSHSESCRIVTLRR